MKSRYAGAAALLALAACGSDPVAEGAPDATIETPGGRAEIRSGGSTATGIGGIPAYPGAETIGGIQVSGASEKGAGRIVTFRTSDPPAEVIAFYTEAAERAGFRVVQRMTMGGTEAMTAQRAEGEGLHVSAQPTGEGTQVQLIAGTGR